MDGSVTDAGMCGLRVRISPVSQARPRVHASAHKLLQQQRGRPHRREACVHLPDLGGKLLRRFGRAPVGITCHIRNALRVEPAT